MWGWIGRPQWATTVVYQQGGLLDFEQLAEDGFRHAAVVCHKRVASNRITALDLRVGPSSPSLLSRSADSGNGVSAHFQIQRGSATSQDEVVVSIYLMYDRRDS